MNAPSSRRSRILAVAPLVGALLVACGVPASDGPQPLPSELKAIGPSAPESSPAATDASPAATIAVGVAWVSRRQFVLRDRFVEIQGRAGLVNAALDALVAGTDGPEQELGLRTMVPPDSNLSAELSGRRAVIELELGSAQVNQGLAVGQVALSALSVSGVHSVVFTVDGNAIPVPLPGGRNTDRPVTVRDYQKRLK